MSFSLIKEIQFDAGHRVPEHQSKCRNPHGHRYRVEVHVHARNLVAAGPATGMVLDFGDVKTLLMEKVHDVLDHGFIVFDSDIPMLTCFGLHDGKQYAWEAQGTDYKSFMSFVDWKIVLFPYVPTAENIARWVFEELQEPINNAYNEHAYLDGVKVWETPTSSAAYFGEYTE